jgi:ABC-type arginine transport system ATPase subunit
MDECLPTGSEITSAAARILMLGVHVHLTNANLSATTPEIEARLHKFAKQLQDLVQAAIAQDDPDRLQ